MLVAPGHTNLVIVHGGEDVGKNLLDAGVDVGNARLVVFVSRQLPERSEMVKGWQS
jgi:hypothetical protein